MISFERLYDKDNIERANVSNISWAVWADKDLTNAPSESGSGLSTDSLGALEVPSTATGGIVMLYVSNTDMALLDTDIL